MSCRFFKDAFASVKQTKKIPFNKKNIRYDSGDDFEIRLPITGFFRLEIGKQNMSPVSPVFHTEATVSIRLKTYSEWEHPFYNIRCPCCEAGIIHCSSGKNNFSHYRYAPGGIQRLAFMVKNPLASGGI